MFLVPKVTLVEQQGDFITENTPLRVIKLHGALDLSLVDREGWQAKFSRFDVFVMTGASPCSGCLPVHCSTFFHR